MGEVSKMQNDAKLSVERKDLSLVEIANGVLYDARANIVEDKVISMPIAQLATLGAGVSSLLPAFRMVTQTATISSGGLYRLVNDTAGIGLKSAGNNLFWGATNASKMGQFQAAGPLSMTTQSVAAINPAVVMMAVALFSIEQKLGNILEMEKRILSFLEVEKESEIEADIQILTSIITKYKNHWDNEHFIASNHKMVLDIQRTAWKHMISYQKNVTDVLNSKQLVVSHRKVNTTLHNLLNKFKYYRLSLYTFSLASFMEIMLGGDFKEETIADVRSEIEAHSSSYREIFGKCSVYLEELSVSALETKMLKGAGIASGAVGKLIGSIPVIKDGQVDEFLQDRGDKIKENAIVIEEKVVEDFAQISNPETGVFIEKMNDMIQIYGHTEEIYFDDKQIYLVAG